MLLQVLLQDTVARCREVHQHRNNLLADSHKQQLEEAQISAKMHQETVDNLKAQLARCVCVCVFAGGEYGGGVYGEIDGRWVYSDLLILHVTMFCKHPVKTSRNFIHVSSYRIHLMVPNCIDLAVTNFQPACSSSDCD